MKYDLTPQQRGDNEEAAKAMFALVGGYTGYFNLPPDRLNNFAQILNADPNDDLSGLRLLASRMQYGIDLSGPQSVEAADRFVEPQVARWWLQKHRGAHIVEGELQLGLKPDHLAIAALAIANSEVGADFYDVYATASNSIAPLSREVVTNIARGIIDSYFSSPELEASLYPEDS